MAEREFRIRRSASSRTILVRTAIAGSLGTAFLLAAPSVAVDRDVHRAPAAQQLKPLGQSSVTKARAKRDALAAASSPSALAASCGEAAIAPGASPGGYVPLSIFGGNLLTAGDDTTTSFSTPSFHYAGHAYSEIQVASNGYLQAGPTANISLLNQSFPDPGIPNTVLAPFWTDLNPAASGEVRATVLTNGTDTWIVVDWAGVPEFSTASHTHSFEVWIGIDADGHPGQDISFVYGPNTGTGDVGFASVGAENAEGTSGGNTYFNGVGTLPTEGTELRVTDPGGGLSADFSASPSSGAAPLHVGLDASASSDDVGIVSYDWDFGDSSTGSGVTTGHDYAAGTYTATLTVSDGDGNSCSTSQDIASEGAFSVDDVTVNEGASTATFTVSRPGGPAASVDVATVAGSAQTPADFSAAPATLSFAAGQLSRPFTVTVNQDLVDELNEAYSVVLSNAVAGSVADGTGAGTIVDDDAPASLSVNDANITEGNTGTKPLTFTVSLNRVSGKTVRVTFRTANGAAVAPSDYRSQNLVVTFTPGQRSKTVTVPIVGDRRREPNEGFFVLLNNPVNATIGDPNGSGGIIDND